jgi:hypothetical protein
MELRTAREVFEALGGISAVAEITGSRYTAAQNWISRDQFPANTFLSLTQALERKNLSASVHLWKMKPSHREAAE